MKTEEDFGHDQHATDRELHVHGVLLFVLLADLLVKHRLPLVCLVFFRLHQTHSATNTGKWCHIPYLGGANSTLSVSCKRLLHTVGYLGPSATISRWTTFLIGCCNCAIQDGVQDGRRGFASSLQKDSLNLFSKTQSNVDRFPNFSSTGFYGNMSSVSEVKGSSMFRNTAASQQVLSVAVI